MTMLTLRKDPEKMEKSDSVDHWLASVEVPDEGLHVALQVATADIGGKTNRHSKCMATMLLGAHTKRMLNSMVFESSKTLWEHRS